MVVEYFQELICITLMVWSWIPVMVDSGMLHPALPIGICHYFDTFQSIDDTF